MIKAMWNTHRNMGRTRKGHPREQSELGTAGEAAVAISGYSPIKGERGEGSSK